jgi:acyl transferase domain-containing protein
LSSTLIFIVFNCFFGMRVDVGLMLALTPLEHQALPAIMHCRNLNPYVASSLQEWTTTANVVPRVPVELAPTTLARVATSGTSSFGMSGVNAHFITSSVLSQALPFDAEAAVWKRSRYNISNMVILGSSKF